MSKDTPNLQINYYRKILRSMITPEEAHHIETRTLTHHHSITDSQVTQFYLSPYMSENYFGRKVLNIRETQKSKFQ